MTKYYPSKMGKQFVFRNLNFSFPENKNIALLGGNGAGKSTLFRIISGADYPNRGEVRTERSLSWPVALSTGIHKAMTGQENARFIGRINGVADLAGYEARVKAFAELGDKFYLPVQSYSSGMRTRLAFACSIGIDFDIYLIDEVTSVGDAKFRAKAREALKSRAEQANVIMVSHEMDELRYFCESAIVIKEGKLHWFDELEAGIEEYQHG